MGLGDIFKSGQYKAEIERLQLENQQLRSENQNLIQDNQNLSSATSNLRNKLQEIGAFDYYKVKEMTNQLEQDYDAKKTNLEKEYSERKAESVQKFQNDIASLNDILSNRTEKSKALLAEIDNLQIQEAKLNKNLKTQINKLSRTKELIKAINYSLDNYFNYEPATSSIRLPVNDLSVLEEISPSVILKLHCMDVKDLRKAYRENDKQITSVLEKYASRYTTKANQAIYKLMVIALRAELQNTLYNLKFEKLEKSIEDVKLITHKYLKIAGDGNQSIAGTLTKFIGEIEYLFINAVKIEYNYYVKKEQAKTEQAAIREQMRQEVAERKALEAERKKVEQEESKFHSEIEKLKEQMTSAQEKELEALNARILSLQSQLADVIIKKEEISHLANGKAGNVYVISNLGSFGDNVFKIGMTRRLNPQDRVNELSDASVPFKFDVHSFIFSNDAVGLEHKLHSMLNDRRVNKVNMRKEFFYTTIDDLEELVTNIEPTAEFNKTMLAEEFRQSLSSDENYSSIYISDDDYSDEDE